MLEAHYKPATQLRVYIDRYWLWSADSVKNSGLFPLFAGTGVDLFIHFGTSFSAQGQTLASSHIICPRRIIPIVSSNTLNFIAVRFRCGAFRHFCAINFDEMNNSFLPLEDIWGKQIEELREQLQEDITPLSRISLLDSFFLKQFTNYRKENQLLDHSISYLYNNYNKTTVYALANEMNMSLRHFERLFKDEFGISPKKFQSISRFQSTLKQLLLNPNKDHLQIAFENGYYDQSHFIKDCKSFSDLSPTQLQKMKDEKDHFYFEKML